jgi:hypothetical protein
MLEQGGEVMNNQNPVKSNPPVNYELLSPIGSRFKVSSHHTVRSQADRPNNADASRLVRVEIESGTILQLLKGRRICASDMRCLDCESKRCLMRLLLEACLHDMAENG